MNVPGSSIKNTSTTFLNNDVITANTGNGTSSTNATAGLYHTNVSTDMAIAMTAGSGVGQTNVPGLAFSGASELDTHINAFWQLNTGFAPGAQFPGINYSFPIGGVVGIGGNDHFIVSLTFYDVFNIDSDDQFSTQIGSLSIDEAFSNSTGAPQTFATTITGNDILNNGIALPAGSEFEVLGDIIFKAKNDESPSSFDFTADTNFGASSYTTAPTGDENFATVVATALPVPVPLPSTVQVGALAIGLMGLRRWIVARRSSSAI